MKSIRCLLDTVLSQVPVPWALSFCQLQTRFAKLCPIVFDMGQLTESRPHRECRGLCDQRQFCWRNMWNVVHLRVSVSCKQFFQSFWKALQDGSLNSVSASMRALCCIFSRVMLAGAGYCQCLTENVNTCIKRHQHIAREIMLFHTCSHQNRLAAVLSLKPLARE